MTTDISDLRIQIDFDDEDPYIEEAAMRGRRTDVLVYVGGRKIEIGFYHPSTLKYEIDVWDRERSYNLLYVGVLVIQYELDNESIRRKIERLHSAGVFD
jgi:hypothetical protein